MAGAGDDAQLGGAVRVDEHARVERRHEVVVAATGADEGAEALVEGESQTADEQQEIAALISSYLAT